MAYKKIKNNSYIADTVVDLTRISEREKDIGASCYVIKEACEYRLMSTGEWVKQAATSVSTGDGGSVDLSGYATESYVDEKIANSIPNLSDYVNEERLRSERISISSEILGYNFAKKDYVDEKINEISAPEVDLSNYATKAELAEIQATTVTSGEMTAATNRIFSDSKDYTDAKVRETEGKIPSLEGYAMTVEVEAVKSNPALKFFDMNRNPGGHDAQAIYLKAGDQTLTDAMIEKGIGVYNVWIEKGHIDLPKTMQNGNASGRGVAIVDFQQNGDTIGYAILFDKLNNMYYRFVSHNIAGPWMKVQAEED